MRQRGRLHGQALCVAAFSLLSTIPGPVIAQSDGRWKSGEEVYVKVCGRCHESGVGRVIKGRAFPPQAYGAFVRHGHLAMPSFRSSEIDDRALQALGEFLARAPISTQVDGDAERGFALVASGAYGCAACHAIPDIRFPKGNVGPPLIGMAGRSLIAGQLPNRPDVLAAFLRNPPALAPQTGMPNVGLSLEQARDIAAYLYTLEAPNGP
ncbi:c-type cytochrome [Microvirga brassicacearum]|uniref:C-type cytochrome n=1 Tax=Microvirga brassicacearum TaxID=2580413 RepID=A0A5N3P769_9HYPH|nr:c-type cytochrome [Microvirga brassicacearum]KAB0265563.1 c-type cytochrome [Microvirga brassicacearum]